MNMESDLQVFALFWMAGALVMLGGLLSLLSKSSKVTRAGKFMALVGGFSIIISPWTIPSSPSSAFGHFFGSILGPTALLTLGMYNIAFSGNMSVERLSKTERRNGFIMVFLALLWFEGMHWWQFTPTYQGEINPYWLIFWATLLLVSSGFTTTAFVMVRGLGDQRDREQRLLLVVQAMLFLLVFLGLQVDGPNVLASDFVNEIWLVGADVFGMVVGGGLAILMFTFVIFIYESQSIEPQVLHPPTEEELKQAVSILSPHVSGGAEDE